MQIENEFIRLAAERYEAAFERCLNVIKQLNDDQVWFRPSSRSNSIGIIIQHLNGNLNQWILDSLGGYNYQRNRPSEFEDNIRASRDEIIKTFSELGLKVNDTILKIIPEDLLSSRHIQGLDMTVMAAILYSLTHFELHAGQITYITKLQLNENYKEQWRPVTKEKSKA
jgi:hypothetical protein